MINTFERTAFAFKNFRHKLLQKTRITIYFKSTNEVNSISNLKKNTSSVVYLLVDTSRIKFKIPLLLFHGFQFFRKSGLSFEIVYEQGIHVFALDGIGKIIGFVFSPLHGAVFHFYAFGGIKIKS